MRVRRFVYSMAAPFLSLPWRPHSAISGRHTETTTTLYRDHDDMQRTVGTLAAAYRWPAATRQMTFPTSSATSNAPLPSIATPTGRPIASPFSRTKPVRTSIDGPDGLPPENGTKITLYPLRGFRFQEPC
jgi:hypothetical protein